MNKKPTKAAIWTVITALSLILIYYVPTGLVNFYCQSDGHPNTAQIISFERTGFSSPDRWKEYIPGKGYAHNSDFLTAHYTIAYQFSDAAGKIHTGRTIERFDNNAQLQPYSPGNTIQIKYLPSINWGCWTKYEPQGKDRAEFWPVIVATIILGLFFYFYFRNKPNVNQ